jgi:diguanylate cyclase (GGDEF)-like protein/PAS domain S-box-containing protein
MMQLHTSNAQLRFLDTAEGKTLMDQAERYLDTRGDDSNETIENDLRMLVQKLRVYQIELEMQNEQLQQTQRFLDESKSRYVQLFHHCPSGMAIINRNGILEKVNETLAHLLGTSCGELTGRPIHELLTKDSEELFLGRFRAFFNNPETKAIECTCLPFSGKKQILQMRGARVHAPMVIRGIDSNTEVLLASFQDITAEKSLQEEIARSSNELNQIFQSAIPLQVIDLDFRITKVNQAFCQLINKKKEELIGNFCFVVWPSPACKTEHCSLNRIRNDHECSEKEKNLRLPKSETRRYLVKTTAAKDQDGNLQGIVKAAIDVTERTKAEQALAASEEQFRGIIENTSDLILTFSRNGTLIFTNQALQKALGYSVEQFAGLHFQDICHQDCFAQCWQTFQEMLRGRIRQNKIETVFQTAAGEKIQVEGTVNIHVNKRQKIQAIRGIFRDITLRKTMESRLRTISITDELTGLLNRRGFMEKATKTLFDAEQHQIKLTLLYVDLDGMKHINDTLGHETGDLALIDMAEIFRAVFRQTDLISRIGGDEFVVLFAPSQDIPGAIDLGKRLDEYANHICLGKTRPYTLSMSIGSETFIPGSGVSLELLLSKADSAMYAIKGQRKERRQKTKQAP